MENILLQTKNHKVFGYFTEWSIYSRKYSVEHIPFQSLTHIIYAFMLPNPSEEDIAKFKNGGGSFPPVPYTPPPTVLEGSLIFHDEYAGLQNIEKLKQAKLKYPHINVLISVGGWTLSWTMSKIMKDQQLRQNLIESSVKFVIENSFDGLDFDWEFVGKQGQPYNYCDPENDGVNFGLFLKEMRQFISLKYPNLIEKFQITAATGCDPIVIQNYKHTVNYLDYMLLMTYDFAGSWGEGGHHSPLKGQKSSVQSSVQIAQNTGFKNKQICVGSPFYGRGWAQIQPHSQENPIFGKNQQGPAITKSIEHGVAGNSSWKDILNCVNQQNGYRIYEDKEVGAVYAVNQQGETWSFENPWSAKLKANFVGQNNLGGVFAWELSDDAKNGDSLMQNIIMELNKF